MGLTKNMIFLLMSSSFKRKVSFENVVMIGRQNLQLRKQQLTNCFDFFGYSYSDPKNILNQDNSFADSFFEILGAKKIDSIDASNYEGASIIHDLNEPLPNQYKSKYSLVLDSGTLEHIFNFPIAIANCMNLTKIGGHFIGIYPCNNFFGHGFYQFSSELFYRIFCKENGFETIDILLFVDEPDTTFYSVPDTNEEFNRIQFTNSKPVYLYVLAKRLEKRILFENQPLQMDYAQLKWKGKRSLLKPMLKKKSWRDYFPLYLKNLLKAIFNKSKADDDNNFKKTYFSIYDLKS